MKTASPSSAFTELLDAEHIAYEVIPHRRTETAAAEARALGIDPAEVAKTLVLVTNEGFVRAVLPATERIDLDKVRGVLDCDELQLATELVLAGAYPDFELGAVPPVAGVENDRVVVDRRVSETASMVFEAGTHEHSVRLSTADLITLAGATIADICAE
jgi:Ala-tRNA(Pro) deacylase